MNARDNTVPCRYCRQPTLEGELVDGICPTCRADLSTAQSQSENSRASAERRNRLELIKDIDDLQRLRHLLTARVAQLRSESAVYRGQQAPAVDTAQGDSGGPPRRRSVLEEVRALKREFGDANPENWIEEVKQLREAGQFTIQKKLKAEAELKEARQQLNFLGAEIGQLKDRSESERQTILRLREERARLEQATVKLRTDVKNWSHSIRQRTAHVEEMEQKLEEKQKRVNELEQRSDAAEALRRRERKIARKAGQIRWRREKLVELQRAVKAESKTLALSKRNLASEASKLREQESRLDERNQEILKREDEIRRLPEALEQRQRQLERVRKALDVRKGRIEKREARVKAVTEENDALRKERIALKRDIEAATAEAESLERKLKYRLTEIARLKSGQSKWQQAKPLRQWITAGLGYTIMPTAHQVIATTGKGPYHVDELDLLLEASGAELWYLDRAAGISYCSTVIVGREGWSPEELEAQIAAREGNEIRIYSQEMFLVGRALGRDPFVECTADELKNLFGVGHSALEYLMTSDLSWPNCKAPDLPTKPSFIGGAVSESPLHILGYRVGRTSELRSSERRRILKQAFTTDKLPFVDSRKYMHEWGTASGRRRLWRMAHHITWMLRMQGHKKWAKKDWGDDLSWLKKEFYRPWMRFKWPEVAVPGDF